MKRFESPKEDLRDLKAEALGDLLEWSADLVLLLDLHARVIDSAGETERLDASELRRWKGKLLADLVTQESRGKLLALIDAAMQLEPLQPVSRAKSKPGERAGGMRDHRISDGRLGASQAGQRSIWRQLNHSLKDGSLPISYRVRRLHPNGPLLAIGRSMDTIAKLQQQFVQSQQQVEREMTRLRDLEMRYRLLFQHSEDPLMLLDTHSLRVVEANAASQKQFQWSEKRLANKSLSSAVDAKSLRIIRSQVDQLRASGQAEEARVRHAKRKDEYIASLQALRHEGQIQVLLRLSPVTGVKGSERNSTERSQALAAQTWFDHSPDAIVVCDHLGAVQRANPAFIDMVSLAHEGLARGESLGRWLGRGAVDLDMLLGGLRQAKSVRHYLTSISSEFGAATDVEIAAAHFDEHAKSIGFTLRACVPRNASTANRSPAMSRSMEQLSELVGSVSLKDLVRESTDVIERLCIEAALQMTKDNRASAAEMLGLSRQSLYTKLRRYGLAEYENSLDLNIQSD